MGYLIHFVLAFAALAAAENGLGSLGEWPAGLVPLALVPHALLALTRRAYLRGSFRLAELLERLLIWSPPALYLLALGVCGWTQTVERWTGVETGLLIWPHPAELLALAPFLIFGLISIDARARVGDTRDTEVARTRRFHQRMFATGAVPVTLFVLVAWALSSNRVVRVHLEEVSLLSAFLGAVCVLAFVLALPAALSRLWDTQPMPPGPRRRLLEELAARAGFRCRAILVWVTGHRMSNAAVIGLSPRTRRVLFTDALLSQLSLRELSAVFAHEMGHVQHRHALTFLSWALAFFLGIDLCVDLLPITSDLLALALLCAAFVFWLVGFGWLSRRVELEADLYSLELTGDLGGIVGALERVGSTHPRKLSTWRHFSTARRVEHLALAFEDPGVAARHHRWLRTVGRVGLALMIVTVALQGWQLLEAYPQDRLRADVRLGDYESASQRLSDLPELEARDPSFARALRRGAALGDEAGPEVLEAEARDALTRGNLVEALDYALLAQWRGVRELEPLTSVLEAHLAGEASDDETRAAVPDSWRGDLARALRTGSR